MLLTASAFALLVAPAAAPDRILVNAVVHTMDESRPRVEAVAMTEGRISALGSTADLLALKDPHTEVIDLHGATVVPGLKESHGHFVGIGMARLTLNLVGTKSWDEVVTRVAAAVKGRPKGAWSWAEAGTKGSGRRSPLGWFVASPLTTPSPRSRPTIPCISFVPTATPVSPTPRPWPS